MNREIIAYTIDWESKLRKFSGKHKMELPEDLTEMTCWLEIDQGTISGAGVSFWFPIEKAPERCYSIMCTLEGDQAETARIGALVKHLVKAVHKERSHTLFLGFAMDEKKAVNKEALLYNGFKQFDTMHELEAPFPMTYPELQNYKGPHKALFLEY
ncbi:MAG: hypothetical protein GY729_21295, partial [Desulfobacteraceae bacterium]|nr:hypothetical protein [Desulfobacteraceae bacterium]